MTNLRFLLLVAVIVTSWGCQSTPSFPVLVTPKTTPNDRTATAESLLAQANRATQAQASPLYLQAGFQLMNRGDWVQAEQALARVESARLPSYLIPQYHLANSRLALNVGDLSLAKEHFSAYEESDPSALDEDAHWVKAALCAADNNYVCAAERLMLIPAAPIRYTDIAENLTNDKNPNPMQQQHDQIWIYMNRTPAPAVLNLAQTRRGGTQGWWALKAATQNAYSVAEQKAAIVSWREKWANHPANALLPTPLTYVIEPEWEATRVALLLPLSGNLGSAGMAVRDGFLAAYLHTGSQSEIAIYDSANAPIATLYEQILSQGAQLIVGPLAKGNVTALNDLNPEIPVLGLNYIDVEATHPNLFQLGLAIEDEADTILNQLLADGTENLLIIHSTADWSVRAANRLIEQWPMSISVEQFEDVKKITEALGRAMQVDASHRRGQEIFRILGTHIEFQPRARKDADAIVALTNNTETNALVPALRFHYASKIPIYASSQSIRGADSKKIKALSGFRITELPWHLYNDSLYQAMNSGFDLAGNNLSPLYALGADALRVANQLPIFLKTSDFSLLGNTGRLMLAPERRFHRDMGWGLIGQGKVLPVPYVATE